MTLGLCLQNPTYLPFYSLFYLGVAELSNIPLSMVDIQRTWPSVVPSSFVQNIANVSFALSFFALRIVMWTYLFLVFLLERFIGHSGFEHVAQSVHDKMFSDRMFSHDLSAIHVGLQDCEIHLKHGKQEKGGVRLLVCVCNNIVLLI